MQSSPNLSLLTLVMIFKGYTFTLFQIFNIKDVIHIFLNNVIMLLFFIMSKDLDNLFPVLFLSLLVLVHSDLVHYNKIPKTG